MTKDRTLGHLSELANVNSLLSLKAEGGSYLLIGPSSLVQEVIDEEHQGPATAYEGVHMVVLLLLPLYYYPRLNRDMQHHLSHCPNTEQYLKVTKRK